MSALIDYRLDLSPATVVGLCRYCPYRTIQLDTQKAQLAMRTHLLEVHIDIPGVEVRIQQAVTRAGQ